MSTLCVRLLQPSDQIEYLQLLSQLSPVCNETFDLENETFARLTGTRPDAVHVDAPCSKHIYVAFHENKLVGTAALLIEQKLTRNCGSAAHIEDVVVDAAARGAGVGRALVEALIKEARARGCYKAVLSCAEANVGFYEACGFRKHEVTMAAYLEKK